MSGERAEAVRTALAELRAEYVLELPQRVEELAAAIRRARGDWSNVEQVVSRAHKICGTAGSYGFASLSEAAGRIEAVFKAASGGSAPPPEAAWKEIEGALADVT